VSAIRTLARAALWLILALLFYAGMMSAYWYTLHAPLDRELTQTIRSLERMLKSTKECEVIASRLPDVWKEFAHLDEGTRRLDQMLPASPALPLLRFSLDRYAAHIGVSVIRLEPFEGNLTARTERVGTERAMTVPLRIEAQGGLTALADLVTGLARSRRLLSVSAVTLQRAPKTGFQLSLEAETYVWKRVSKAPRGSRRRKAERGHVGESQPVPAASLCKRDTATLFADARLVVAARPLDAELERGEGWRRLRARYRATRRFKGPSEDSAGIPGTVLRVAQLCLEDPAPPGHGSEPTAVALCSDVPEALPGFSPDGAVDGSPDAEVALYLAYPFPLQIRVPAGAERARPDWEPLSELALEPACSPYRHQLTPDQQEGLRQLEAWLGS
jgi:Tfp pilus assembly protein PilO